MKLQEIVSEFRQGVLGKQEYIDRMYALHCQLFDYADYLKDTDISQIEISEGTLVTTSRSTGVRIAVGRTDKRTAPLETLNFGTYEDQDSRMLLRVVPPQAVIYDIGANIGWYSLALAKMVAGARVHAFEPIPDTYAQLCLNIKLNAPVAVEPHHFGFSDHNGEATFYYDEAISVRASAARLVEGDNSQKITCRIERLDDFAGDTTRVDFIKCDVEGGELFVFRGALKTLSRCKPAIFCEMLRKWSLKFNYHPNDIIALLGSLGYQCFTARGNALCRVAFIDEGTLETNFFFLHPDRHAEQIKAMGQ